MSEIFNLGLHGAQVELEDGYLTMIYGEQRFPLCSVEAITHLQSQLQQIETTHHRQEHEKRYTEEGIDRFFTTQKELHVDPEMWVRDSQSHWRHYTGPELFATYPNHAQVYCQGCREHRTEPTYEGFRGWLVDLIEAE